jgi:hypothetical protein
MLSTYIKLGLYIDINMLTFYFLKCTCSVLQVTVNALHLTSFTLVDGVWLGTAGILTTSNKKHLMTFL